MEYVLALVIGLAVACTVFALGRTFVGLRNVSKEQRDLPPLAASSISEAVDPPASAISQQTLPAHGIKPLEERRFEDQVVEPAKKTPKKSARRPPQQRALQAMSPVRSSQIHGTAP